MILELCRLAGLAYGGVQFQRANDILSDMRDCCYAFSTRRPAIVASTAGKRPMWIVRAGPEFSGDETARD